MFSLMSTFYFSLCFPQMYSIIKVVVGGGGGLGALTQPPSPASNNPGRLSFFFSPWSGGVITGTLLPPPQRIQRAPVMTRSLDYHFCPLFHAESNVGRHSDTLDDVFWHCQDPSCAFTYAMTQISVPLYTPSTLIRAVQSNKSSCTAALSTFSKW